MSALLPCPFCGEGADLMELFEGFCGECGNCETTGPAAETEAAAIAAWNQRATPTEVEKLRAERDKYQRRSEVAERAFWRLLHNHTTLRADARLMALALLGQTPDGTTQDGAQATATQADIDAAVARCAALAKETADEG